MRSISVAYAGALALLLVLVGCGDRSPTATRSLEHPQMGFAPPIDPCNETWTQNRCSDMMDAIFSLALHPNSTCSALGWAAQERMTGGGTWGEFVLMEYEAAISQQYYAISIASQGRTRYNESYWDGWGWQGWSDRIEMLKSLVAHEEAHLAGWGGDLACVWNDACSSNPIPECDHS